LIQENPTHLVEKAIIGMLPKNIMGRAQSTKLKVYAGAEHPHASQNPSKFEITQVSQIVKK
jgi:large subunit ribosomal protein L13